MPIICAVCGAEVKEAQYPEHMNQHGGVGNQLKAIQQEKEIAQNVPKQIEVPLDPNAPLPPEFAELAAMIDSKPQKSTVAQPPTYQGPPTPKEIELTYKYVGNCENGHSVATLETDVEEKHFAICYCLQCNKQIESRKVVNLKETYHIEVDVAKKDEDFTIISNIPVDPTGTASITVKKKGKNGR